jgi:hypothetical protein
MPQRFTSPHIIQHAKCIVQLGNELQAKSAGVWSGADVSLTATMTQSSQISCFSIVVQSVEGCPISLLLHAVTSQAFNAVFVA